MCVFVLYVAKWNLVKIEPLLVTVDHAPLFEIRVFAKLQMTHTRSGRLCSSFELQILLLSGSFSLPLTSFFVGLGEYRGWLGFQ